MIKLLSLLKIKNKQDSGIHIETSHYVALQCCRDCGALREGLPPELPPMINAPFTALKCCPKCGSTKLPIEKVGRVKYSVFDEQPPFDFPHVPPLYNFIEFIPKSNDD